MSLLQKDALRTMILSYGGLIIGYLNRGIFFLVFLSPTQIGLVNLVISVGLLFAQCSNLGTIYAVLKFFPFFRNKEKNNYGFLQLIIAIVLLGIVLFSGLTYLFEEQIAAYFNEKSSAFVDYFYWIIPIGFANIFFLLFDNYLRGFHKNIIGVFANELIYRLAVFVLLLAIGFDLISFETFLVAYFLANFIPPIILFFYLVRMKEISFSFASIEVPKRFRKIIVQYSLFNYLNSLGSLTVLTMDSIMIASMIGLDSAGVYSQIIFLTSALMIPYRSLMRVSTTYVTYFWKERNMKKMQALYTNSSSVALFLTLFMFMGVWLNIDDLFTFLPEGYQEGIWVFFFLMIGRMLDMYFGVNGTILQTSKKYKYDILFTFILVGVVYAANLWLIPIYGIVGAAISTSIAFVLYNFCRLIFVLVAYKLHPFTKEQFILLGLFAFTILIGEYIFPLTSNPFLNIGIQISYILLTFCWPVYYFKLEPNTADYLKQGSLFLRKKLSRKTS